MVKSETKTKKSNRILWIDCAKLVAIVAVVVDHNTGVLFDNRFISSGSYFSVTLFILLSGISTLMSHNRRPPFSAQQLTQQFKLNLLKQVPFLTQYAIATFLLLILRTGFFDFKIYLTHLLHFSVVGPLYFVFFFLQLKVATPFLLYWYEICENRRYAFTWHFSTLAGIAVLSSLFVNYTHMLDLVGGGGIYLAAHIFSYTI